MKRLIALLVLVPTLTLAAVSVPGVAHAACEGPTISYRGGDIEAGDELVIEGLGWGDNCYDTGPPPGDEGVLGNPLTRIDVFLVQNGQERLVARGDADQDYEFLLRVKIPSDLEAGRVEVAARAGFDTGWVDREPILKYVPGGPETVVDVVTFGPAAVVPEAQADGPAAGDGESLPGSAIVILVLGALLVILVLAGAGALLLSRRQE